MAKTYKLLGNTYKANRNVKNSEQRLERIDAILKQNPTHEFDGTYLQGMKELAGAQPKKVKAIINATKDLEKKFKCKIKWKTMEWYLVVTTGRYNSGPQGLGSGVQINGKTDKGDTVIYKYRQPSSAESGSREFQLGRHSGTNSDFT